MTLAELNGLSDREAKTELLRCCGSKRWAGEMSARRPFPSRAGLLAAAGDVWAGLEANEWKRAFAAHPRIGDIKALRKKFASTASWAEGEQSGVARTSEKTIKALAECNRLYEARFGYFFIVCATGKSAGEMLRILKARLDNRPADEISIAAEEQRKIMIIRLEKLLTHTQSRSTN